ncbi:carboxypeptidase regulatory-like domain-containing protein [Aggregicoccus sp. 17bor-14]|uniref:carboxypeptidase-like regulatory domain-containing protein n=1 Tax=Myxococcaceae TaxID=31 RepID=UPI00129C3311|nr:MULTISPECIES: carboxypeptidase-like regulatory domain-containing protein [Myxococcaceae]MBF5042416.1 carboxypeptidase regulatory-like domain-containing protein [Simulacricoccus sp. 17bor-14]MRI88188.1 carboxypeptidase regulatory-like domain-containing protein [Aggregicoccus sp. 17bor-14]
MSSQTLRLAAVLLLLPGAVHAGSILGTALDVDTRRPLPGVTVRISSPSLAFEQAVLTDADGRYQLAGLPPGRYRMRFEGPSVDPYSRSGVQLHAEGTLRINVELLRASNARGECVLWVFGPAPITDVGSAQQGMSFNRSFTDNLPLPRL